MAKIADLKFQINGEDFSVPVNCTSTGEFNTNLPGEVARKLDIRSRLTGKTLADLKTEFYNAINRFKTAETKREVFIAIQYGSNGSFNEGKEGNALHAGYGHKYTVRVDFGKHADVLSFCHRLVLCETVDTVETWYNARKGDPDSIFTDRKKEDPDKFYPDGRFVFGETFKTIPFSQAALDSLDQAREKIRAVSELLFHFIEQDELKIEETLTKTKLLK